MESHVTQCPQCQTAFRVNDEQLEVAKGKVRCGSCLHVFRADHHWVDPVVEPDEGNSGSDVLNLFEDEDTNETPLVANTQELEALIADETDDDGRGKAKQEADELEFSESFLELDNLGEDDNLFNEFEELADELKDDDEAWARQLLAEMEDEDGSPTSDHDAIIGQLMAAETDDEGEDDQADGAPIARPELEAIGRQLETPEPQYKEKWLLDLEQEQEQEQQEALQQAELEVNEDDSDPSDSASFLEAGLVAESFSDDLDSDEAKQQLLDNIEPAPVEMHWQHTISPLQRQALWACACLLAVAGLVGQYVAYNFDELARATDTRPRIASLCQLVGCEMPTVQDLSQVNTASLVVRPHPRHADALQLDAIIRNYASFRQPFPLLYVRFSTLAGDTAAARVFSPEEYLGGELAGGTLMPVRQDVHLSLSLVKPPVDAPNYEVGFLPGG